ncbi:ferredoxin--NADP+ reductase [Mycolicibacterium neoaurum]|uniref:NAD(P)-binding protein n=1 Tax=Mycolicibacterium neoaurum TaxID=1795 RepID=UPI00088629C5|nr:NAD(P)-binding protein [Mycolicibacterium neoaurum]SDC07179.1 ferredoxin--NADP+ reductase [Mycolicibacterium neoaurum]
MTDQTQPHTAPLPHAADQLGTSPAPACDVTTFPLTIAVIGSGPSGCYAATFLKKTWPQCDITIFESLPTPYGLVRYGIAADHQGTKNVTRQFDRLFTREGVRFAGNVCVGADVEFAELARCFDIVVLATGLPQDRALDVPHPAGTRVIGAGSLLRALNGHPVRALPRSADNEYAALGSQLAVVGMGNVAIDVVRLMSKDPQELHGSDINDDLLNQLRPTRPTSIDVISRSLVSQAKFDLAMMRELLALPNVDIRVTGFSDTENGPAAELLRPYRRTGSASLAPVPERTRVHLHFGLTPESITETDGRAHLRLTAAEGLSAPSELTVDTVITAIGFTHGARDDQSCPNGEWSGPNVYRVGWLSRGPHGAIPENRKDARAVVDTIIHDVAARRLEIGRPGYGALEPLLQEVITFADWQRIEAFERNEAPPGRCRRKITDRRHMLTVATSASTAAAASGTAQQAADSRVQKQIHRESDQ